MQSSELSVKHLDMEHLEKVSATRELFSLALILSTGVVHGFITLIDFYEFVILLSSLTTLHFKVIVFI